MRSHHRFFGTVATLALTLAATPALARHDHDRVPQWDTYQPAYGASFRVDPTLAARCGLGAGSIRPIAYHPDFAYHSDIERRRPDSGIGGALIGGAVGGLVGNRIAGRGDRLIGTVAGAAVGAVAGGAIDRAGDDDRERDGAWHAGGPGSDYPNADAECDSVLPPGYRLVAVPGEQECHDEVTTIEEWVPEYVTVPGRPTTAPVRDKRTKLRRVK